MKTVITHFYNEEYLLPWWLEHHKKYFDFGILIDYNSTDNSRNIIKEICPHWQIVPSGHKYFDARDCDFEVEFYERQISGWRIALTITEFLVGDLNKLMFDTTARVQWYIPGIRFTGWDLNKEFIKEKPLWEQHSVGIPYTIDVMAHQCRSLHNFNDIKYNPGRHFLPHNTEDAMIFHYAHTIVGTEMLKRRLQIQYRISPKDRKEKLGTHHYIDDNGMHEGSLKRIHDDWLSVGQIDCSALIRKIT